MPLFIREYAHLFRRRLEKYRPQCWLINTGWWGGPYGVGKRIDLNITRQIINNCINNFYNDNAFIKSEVLDLIFPQYLDKNRKINLNPIKKWEDKEKYKLAAHNLNQLFKKNFLRFV